MDYEFRRDPFGGYRARFSMGHEAIGQWLIDEVGKDEEKLDELFSIIDQLSNRTRVEYRLNGGDYSLLLTHEEAEVKANALNIELGEDLDDLAYYDDEQLAMCGLEDFAQVLVLPNSTGLTMSIYDFDDELPEDEEQESTKKAAAPAKKKGKQVMNTQVNLSPRDASRLNGMHVEAIATLDDVSLPKNVIFKAGLIALGELEAGKRADIIARVIAESGR